MFREVESTTRLRKGGEIIHFRGYECVVEATNEDEQSIHCDSLYRRWFGMCDRLRLLPDYVPAPSFTKTPKMNITKGVATVSYALELNGRKDESLITWYRCTDKMEPADFRFLGISLE